MLMFDLFSFSTLFTNIACALTSRFKSSINFQPSFTNEVSKSKSQIILSKKL